MDLARLRGDIENARSQFSNVEARLNGMSQLFVKAALQTSAGNVFVLSITFDGYPHSMPKVFVDAPALPPTGPHRYPGNQICYLHPSMWNPSQHNVTFVIARAAKWLNKYEVYKRTLSWPGEEVRH